MGLILAGLIASTVEGFLDRHGEQKTGKRKDSIWLTVVALCLCLIAWLLAKVNPLKTLAVFFAVRILSIDYLINWFLKKYHEDFKKINVFRYIGKTALTDRIISKVHPVFRLVARVLIFLGALFYFFYTP